MLLLLFTICQDYTRNNTSRTFSQYQKLNMTNISKRNVFQVDI